MDAADAAWRLYTKRFRRDTCFADQKSRGCPRHTSPLSDLTRLTRFLMAAGFASLWLSSLGARCAQDGWVSILHRGDRCDRSVFQRGLRLLDYLLSEDYTIPVAFSIAM
jgi:hypothetical protein